MGYNRQTKEMKKNICFVLMAFIGLVFASCNQEVDSRDTFVGEYSFTQTGSATLYVDGTDSGTIPMDIFSK